MNPPFLISLCLLAVVLFDLVLSLYGEMTPINSTMLPLLRAKMHRQLTEIAQSCPASLLFIFIVLSRKLFQKIFLGETCTILL